MSNTIADRILKLKAQMRANEDSIALQARSVACRLRDLADRIERAASEGGDVVDRLFGQKDFSANHFDDEYDRLYVTMWQLTGARRNYSYTHHLLENEQFEQEEEAAAAAIHAGLKNEDEEPANPSGQVYVHIKDWKPSPESQAVLDAMDD